MAAWVVGGAVGGAGLLFFMDRVAQALLRPPVREYPRRVEELAAPHRTLEIPAEGHTLHAWLLEPVDVEPDTLVVLVHGWASNSGQMLDVAEPLLAAGHGVLLVDLRAHGMSGRTEQMTIRHYRDDVRAAARWAAAEHPGRYRVLAGHSLGGGVAAVAVAEGAPADGLALLGAPADFLEVWADYISERGLPGPAIVRIFSPFWRLRAGVPFSALRPVRRLREVRIPVLVVHGEDDRRVPWVHARRLAEAAGVEPRSVPDAGHTEMLADPALHRHLLRFLDRWIGREAPGAG